jgi:hypothetical protein
VLTQLGSAAFGSGYLMTWDWYKLEKLGLIEEVHANFINGELSVTDYTEMVVRIVDPGFIHDLGPYQGVPTLE